MMLFSFFESHRQLLSCCLCGLLLAGCAAESPMSERPEAREKREVAIQQHSAVAPPSDVVKRDVLTPTLASIKSRISAYEQKIGEWKEVEKKLGSQPMSPEKSNKINECKSQLEHILLGYNALHKQLLQETRVDAAQLLAGDSLLQLNQEDIEYLESGCGTFLTELKAMPATATAVAADPQIKAAFDSAEYDRVITLYGQTVLTTGQVPASDTAFQYGQALLKNHQEAEARKVFVDLLPRVRQQQGQDTVILPLLQVIGDLDFCMQSYDEARRHYEELVRLSIDRGARKEEWAGLQLAALQPGGGLPAEMKDYSALLKNYLAYTPKRDGYAVAEQAEKFMLAYPSSRLLANVNIIHKSSREQAEGWLNQGIKRIEALANERKAQEPQTAGAQVDANTSHPSDNQGGVKSGQQVASMQPAAPDEKALQEDYDNAMKLLANREYDKAIERLNKLQKTPYEERARVQIAEAAKLGAQEDRQKAADLFIRATNTRDQASKKKLLLSSRELLQGILAKYPQSGMNDKVQRNLSRIEEELKTIDPTLATPPSKGGAYVPPRTNVGNATPSATL